MTGADGLYQQDYQLIARAREGLDAAEPIPERLRSAVEAALVGYGELLAETEKIHSIADRQYTRLVETQEQLLEANRELERISVHDKLTGLYNRRKLDEILEHEANRCERFGCPATLVVVDIDFFKAVNDEHGHLAGDSVLVALAEILEKRMRRTDFVFRWGGEEFIVLLSETQQAEGQAIAEDIRRLVELHRWPMGIQLTASFGVCEFRPRFTPEIWIEETDKRLYQAKNRGRNRVEGEA